MLFSQTLHFHQLSHPSPPRPEPPFHSSTHFPSIADISTNNVYNMAKSSRASTRKANNQRLVSKVFGPVEDERQQRLAAKLLEIASQPKPTPEKQMSDVPDEDEDEQKTAGKPKANDSKRTPTAAATQHDTRCATNMH